MFINKVKINNYRNFRNFEAILKKITVVIGENCTGKSNFFSALSLPLANNSIDYNQKKLNISDINRESIVEFFNSVLDKVFKLIHSNILLNPLKHIKTNKYKA